MSTDGFSAHAPAHDRKWEKRGSLSLTNRAEFSDSLRRVNTHEDNRLQVCTTGWRWVQPAGGGYNRLQVGTTGWMRYNQLQVGTTGSSWVQTNPGGYNQFQVGTTSSRWVQPAPGGYN